MYVGLRYRWDYGLYQPAGVGVALVEAIGGRRLHDLRLGLWST